MKAKLKLVVGIICICGGLFGLSLKVDNTGHYFGNGTIFGIGLCLTATALYNYYKLRKRTSK